MCIKFHLSRFLIDLICFICFLHYMGICTCNFKVSFLYVCMNVAMYEVTPRNPSKINKKIGGQKAFEGIGGHFWHSHLWYKDMVKVQTKSVFIASLGLPGSFLGLPWGFLEAFLGFLYAFLLLILLTKSLIHTASSDTIFVQIYMDPPPGVPGVSKNQIFFFTNKNVEFLR